MGSRRGRPRGSWWPSVGLLGVLLCLNVGLGVVVERADAAFTSSTGTTSGFSTGYWVPQLYRWGDLGSGTMSSTPAPFDAGTWTQVTVGADHGCGVQAAGTLWCWGSNVSGQLGVGDTAVHSGILQESGGAASWSAASAGNSYTCAVRTNGDLYCWGRGGSGQLGVGGTTDRSNPTRLAGLTATAVVSAGGAYTCAVAVDGSLRCWGTNTYGQLGSGGTASITTPAQVGSSTAWATVSASGSHTCGTRTDGTLWCWGNNALGRTGLGTAAGTTTTPQQVGSDTTWATVSTGGAHTCGTRTDGTLWCWGDGGTGRLGTGGFSSASSPQQVGTETAWSTVTAGDDYACARKTDASLWCWGGNANGQLGVGDTTRRTSPVRVTILPSIQKVSTGNQSTTSYAII